MVPYMFRSEHQSDQESEVLYCDMANSLSALSSLQDDQTNLIEVQESAEQLVKEAQKQGGQCIVITSHPKDNKVSASMITFFSIIMS